MSSVINSILPIFAVIALGFFLKRSGLIDEHFIRLSDRLIYYIFFPLLLFWKIGKPTEAISVNWLFIWGVIFSVFIVFALSLMIARGLKIPTGKVGSFSQSCYRFNSYIGIAVILTGLGENGVKEFGALIGFVIPFINLLAVSSMIRYSPENDLQARRWSILFKSVAANPLIISCLAGVLYSNLAMPLPEFIDKTLSMLSMLSLPLALISIGASLTFSKFQEHFSCSSIAALCKMLVLPVIGYCVLSRLELSQTTFQVGMIYFALPTSPQNYILSSQLGSDVDLATSALVFSTILSIFSISAILILFVN